jgi:hypothetical protein
MAKRLRIQYASDIHLEYMDFPTPFQPILKPVAPVLVLAGDIGSPFGRNYTDFMRYCNLHWMRTFVIAGNHEYYHKTATMEECLKKIHWITDELPNVRFLDRARSDYDGVAFLGTTLWSEQDAGAAMNEYRFIRKAAGTRISPADTTGWFWKDRTWLEKEIAACEEEGRPAVVLTHHLPSSSLISRRFAGNPLNLAFASGCDDLIRAPVRAWIAGHTHVGGHRTWTCPNTGAPILGAVNPRGYPGESGTGYSRELFLEISTEPGNGGDTRDPLLVAAAAGSEDLELR